MSGETNLGTLLQSMQPVLHPGIYVFATVDPAFDCSGLAPRMTFEESEGKTLILLQEAAFTHGIDHEFPSRMISLNIHSSLEAVGFIAAIATKLTSIGMGVNPVAAFHHDHLFIPADRADDAMQALEELSALEGNPHRL